MRKAKLSPPIYHHNKPLYIGKVRIVVAIAYVNAGIAATPHTTLATFANLSLLSPLNINGTNNPISAPMQFISTSVLSASPSPVKACSISNATLNKKAAIKTRCTLSLFKKSVTYIPNGIKQAILASASLG